MAIGDIYEAKFHCYNPPQLALNVRHYRLDGSNSIDDAETQRVLGDGLDSMAAPLYKAVMANDSRYQGLTIQKVAPLPKSGVSNHTGGAGEGTLATETLPKQTCGLVSLRTALGGFRNKGRAYIPFPTEGHNNGVGARPETAYITLLNNFKPLFATPVSFTQAGVTVTATPIVYHRDTLSGVPIIDQVNRQFWATQRRRSDYGAANTSPLA
jgi:hypothetical protein